MSVKTVYVTSENLIKDLAFKQRLGLKADLIDEALAVVEHALEQFNNPELHAKGVKAEQDEVQLCSEYRTPDIRIHLKTASPVFE